MGETVTDNWVNLLGFESIDLSFFLSPLILTFLGSFTLFCNALLSSLLLSLNSFLSTFVGVCGKR